MSAPLYKTDIFFNFKFLFSCRRKSNYQYKDKMDENSVSKKIQICKKKKGKASIHANIGQKQIKVSIAAILCELGELHTGGIPLSWAGRSSQVRALC